MSMKLCQARKHYYDPTVNNSCPYCEEIDPALLSGQTADTARSIAETRRAAASPKTRMAINTAPSHRTEAPQTRLLHTNNDSNHFPVCGWLVIIEGIGKGQDFRLIQGENRIGRDNNMEICLDFGHNSDEAVSRDTHAIVVYDPYAHEFFVERGKSRNLPLLNGATVRGEPILHSHDVLQVGQTKLMFIPLCDKSFSWHKQP